MDEEIKAWLFDILQCIEEIEGYFDGQPKRFDDYSKDTKLKRAVERDLEIIGEAISRILRKEPSFTLSHSRNIIGTRNRIAHAYDNISDELIWGIITNHLPPLKNEVKAHLKS